LREAPGGGENHAAATCRDPPNGDYPMDEEGRFLARRSRYYSPRSLLYCRSHLGGLVALLDSLGRRVPPLGRPAAAFHTAMERYTDRQSLRFDRRFGTDTFTRRALSDLGVGAASGYDFEGWLTGPVNQQFFREIIRNTPADPRDFTFVDVGTGKGKAVMLATDYPFRRVIGVELSHELTEVARSNLRRYLAARGHTSTVQLLCRDFMKYEAPDEPVMFFFTNPFPSSIADLAIRHVEASIERNPRPVFVLYRKPGRAVRDRLASAPSLRPVRLTPFWCIYASRSPGAASGSR